MSDKYNNEPLYPVSVINLATEEVTYTNRRGEFTIQAKSGEKVVFTFIGYKARHYMMPISVGVYNTKIELEPATYRLQELIIMPDYTEYQVDSITRKKTYTPALSRQKSSPFTSPFSFVAEKFNKRSKQIFKFKKNFNKWEDERFIDSRYTPELVMEQTGLSGDSVGHFMNANPMSYDYARAATELELKMWIRYNYKQWLKHIDTAGLPVIKKELIEEID